jgi:hypothetical protein
MGVKEDEMNRACSRHEEIKKACRILVGKARRRPLGGSRCRWVDNIKADLRETGWGGMAWIGLAQDREHGNKPSGSIKRWEVLEWLNNWQLRKKGSGPGSQLYVSICFDHHQVCVLCCGCAI